MKSTKRCPLFSTIRSSSNGDVPAINKILKHYNAYISKASMRPLCDEYGNIHIVVDMELKGQIQSALIEAIMKFEVIIK